MYKVYDNKIVNIIKIKILIYIIISEINNILIEY